MSSNYDAFGVDGYYERMGSVYKNPHIAQVLKVTHVMLTKWIRSQIKEVVASPDELYSIRILDLACGSGEATVGVQEWFKKLEGTHENETLTLKLPSKTQKLLLDVKACDPYTQEAYLQRTGLTCESWSFEDIENGVLELNGLMFDVVIVSFALHLLDESRLLSLCTQLALCCTHLLIISPHKKPEMKDAYGFTLVDSITIDRVHGRLFQSIYS